MRPAGPCATTQRHSPDREWAAPPAHQDRGPDLWYPMGQSRDQGPAEPGNAQGDGWEMTAEG
jgi:hypothetical protein